MTEVRVGICQILVLDGDREGNFVRIENAVEQAGSAGADIVCLPEMAVLGWVNPEAYRRAYRIPGADSDRLGGLARKYGVFVCAGLADKQGMVLYDSAVLMDDEGRILLKHRKINILAELMAPPYRPGRQVKAVETKFGKIGLLICADTHEEAILARMARLGPDIVLVPYGYAAPEQDWPGHGKELQRVITNTAVKTGAAVIGTNLVGQITNGPWKGRVYGGQSAAADKSGGIIERCRDRERDIRVVGVN
ncbi:MAG: carbon-nitrogen hydrolase family protein [Phycisphaerales bacterium]|nr:MAG: carbon-nitrogen hydrolase family protein [Phycisphaerales bacterium]